ncbi:type II toxin-antitoxin system PemK/MazF family toxin [Cryobacterium sp. Hh38]|uniref:type II toxin-antitoxin system PemK/MazF family toxin n=1 Tax=Cryobacterium sp. Hh38 TaxID=1259156 RepID=UPI00106A0B25|nr:type II toxin-antitoxin system PemK/MazF family toxin [Cryobacterium sp. Hh38]TFD62326.1 type II toxin-antitoxin system PemK/MazF family toxin [Cryobacterium sp. Hh38]
MRGDLYRLKTPSDPRGHEQTGARFAVVLQSGPAVRRGEASFRPEVEINGTKTRVLVEQLTAVNQEIRLGEFAGRLNGSKMRAIDAALQNLLGPD